MAARLLLPGMGGKYVSESIPFASTGQDTIDCSRCAQLLFEVTAHSGDTPTITVQHSIDAVNWATLTTFNATLNTNKQLSITAGPFGIIRFQTTGGTSGNTTVAVTGWESQRES